MDNIKKVTPNEIGLEIGLVLSRFFFNTEHLHFGFWPDDLSVNIDNLKKAQDLHSNQILKSIPNDVKTILDVGSGSGGLAEKLVGSGYKVECVSPSEYLSDAIEKKLKSSVVVHRSTFEKFETQKKYDLVLFSESFQYVNINKTLNKLPDIIKDKGHLLICDFFRQPGTGTKPLGGGHDWQIYQNNLGDHDFAIVKDIDITKETARTYDLINQIINEVADPVRDLSAKYLDSHYPKGMRLLKWYFDKKIRRINRIYFAGNMTGKMFNKLKTYRILLYQV
jgi:SAM-dependent methyltransferase|tara:strand:+ start:424 stop:1260 length:837 start_codon:yes stop_codon:yes gene_type:complete